MPLHPGRIQTVLGPVAPHDLGMTLTHEHLLWDPVQGAESPCEAASDRDKWDQDIRLDNYYDVRRNYAHYKRAQQLLSVDDAVEEVGHFFQAGGGAIVEATPEGTGRDPDGLAAISRATGTHIVMGSGYYVQAFHPAGVAAQGEEEIAAHIVAELAEGVGPSRVRAGFIGEIGLSWPVHPDELKVLRGAAQAQQQTGAVLMVHPGRDPEAPIRAVTAVSDAGGNPSRVIVAHVERTVFEQKQLHELAATGCYLELDLFGIESSYYPWSPIDMPNDATRVDMVLELANSGYASQVLLSHDIDMKARLKKYGGEGYSHILRHVVPMFRQKGASAADIHTFVVDNPATAFALA